MPEWVEQFLNDGYVVVNDVFNPQIDLEPIIDDFALTLDDYAVQLHCQGKILSSYPDLSFSERFCRVMAESGEPLSKYFDISLPIRNITEDTPIHLSEAVFNLICHPRLLDLIEQLIGAEILSNPIQHTRIKPPQQAIPLQHRQGLATQTDWHQDQGVSLSEADKTEVVTVWLPITEATETNGCLRVIPRSHRGGLTTHCPGGIGGAVHIPETLLEGTPVALPMQPGSVLFMHRRTQHASLPNISEDIRWSFDLRYQPSGQPTGRPQFPSFIARSHLAPERVLTDYHAWKASWLDARSALSRGELPRFTRWDGSAPVCA